MEIFFLDFSIYFFSEYFMKCQNCGKTLKEFKQYKICKVDEMPAEVKDKLPILACEICGYFKEVKKIWPPDLCTSGQVKYNPGGTHGD